jgi:hypothetical protein
MEKEEIQEIKRNFESEERGIQTETQMNEKKENQIHKDQVSHPLSGRRKTIYKMTAKKKEIDQHQLLLADHTGNFKRGEQLLRKKKGKTEREVANWVQKYDTDMQEKRNEIETIDGEYSIISKELADLEERYNALFKEKEEILFIEKSIKDKHDLEIEKAKQMYLSATRIQRCWKRYWKKVQEERKQKKSKAKTKVKAKKN